jgi:hypothetical protein
MRIVNLRVAEVSSCCASGAEAAVSVFGWVDEEIRKNGKKIPILSISVPSGSGDRRALFSS